VPVLLAARLRGVVRVVLGAHDDRVIRVAGDVLGHVEGEGRVAALVLADERAVDPHAGAVVDRAEVQEHAGRAVRPAGLREIRRRDRAGVPDHPVEAGLGDAGGLGLRREGDEDRLRVAEAGRPALREAGVRVVVAERPRAVEVRPVRAHDLRARVGAVLPGGGGEVGWRRGEGCGGGHGSHFTAL
jgi:hypothetical protein